MSVAIFDLVIPEMPAVGMVVSSPHSGRDYPADFIAQSPLSELALRSSEDAFVDLLVQDAPRLGLPLLSARLPRAYVDLNRAAEDLDPALIEGLKRQLLNPRLSSGLGVIPRVVAGGRVIHPGRISQAEAAFRLRSFWQPWHRQLRELLTAQRARFGTVLLLDCHSMPHEAVAGLRPGGGPAPEVVLGDRHGAACAPDLMALAETAFAAAGFRTSRNMPFAGAYIAQHYGRPTRGLHVIQAEIDRSLYMDEATLQPRPDFDQIRARLAQVMADLAHGLRQIRPGEPLAAE